MNFHQRFGLLLFLIINFAMLFGEVDVPWEQVLFMVLWIAGIMIFLWPGPEEIENK